HIDACPGTPCEHGFPLLTLLEVLWPTAEVVCPPQAVLVPSLPKQYLRSPCGGPLSAPMAIGGVLAGTSSCRFRLPQRFDPQSKIEQVEHPHPCQDRAGDVKFLPQHHGKPKGHQQRHCEYDAPLGPPGHPPALDVAFQVVLI